jgi:uncharacterized protein YcbX
MKRKVIQMHISALFVYPIKSCRGVSVSTAHVQDIGLEHDRRYMIVGPDNVFLTQRDAPSMATIDVVQVGTGWSVHTQTNGALTWEPQLHGPRFAAHIWRDRVEVVDQGDNVAEWFSDVLGRPCRLVGFAPQVRRIVDQTYAIAPTDAVSFADGYASLIVTEESLTELNTRTSEAVPMSRFRPNIVVRGAPYAWVEDSWRHLQVGAVSMTAVKKCARCVMTTTDQKTGQRHAEPLRTLSTYRHIGHGVIFGQNLVHRTTGLIQVGDAVTVTTTNE